MSMPDDALMLALLDRHWRPLRMVPLTQDWRTVVRRLIADEGSCVALFQLRAKADSPDPRPADIALTRALHRRLRALDIRLADHLIVAGDTRFSFRAAGLL